MWSFSQCCPFKSYSLPVLGMTRDFSSSPHTVINYGPVIHPEVTLKLVLAWCRAEWFPPPQSSSKYLHITIRQINAKLMMTIDVLKDDKEWYYSLACFFFFTLHQWIGTKLVMDIHGPHRKNLIYFSNLLTFTIAPPWGWSQWSWVKCLNCWIYYSARKFGTHIHAPLWMNCNIFLVVQVNISVWPKRSVLDKPQLYVMASYLPCQHSDKLKWWTWKTSSLLRIAMSTYANVSYCWHIAQSFIGASVTFVMRSNGKSQKSWRCI